MKKILISLFITLFLCTSAQAYSVGFDVSGLGGFQTIDRLYLDGVDESDIAGNPTSTTATFGNDHLWSFEDANGYFTESFTLDITSADLTAGGKYSASSSATVTDANWDKYFVDVTLQGQFVAGVASFSYGDATMYLDAGTNKDYDSGTDTMVAELTLNPNQIMVLDNTNVGVGVAGQIDMLFTYAASGHDFWDDTTDALVGKGWLLSFLDGEIHVEEVLSGMAAGDYTEPTGWSHDEVETGFGWNVNGLTADFRPIPEPATMLLLGSGLLGLAGLGRKRFFKKKD